MADEESETIALRAVSYILETDELRDRLLALSGLDVDSFRGMLDDKQALASILEFLIAHEPDLLNAAAALHIPPEQLVNAWRDLGGGAGQEW